jgi:hypothetical protein
MINWKAPRMKQIELVQVLKKSKINDRSLRSSL